MTMTKEIRTDYPLIVGSIVDLAGEDYTVARCEPDLLMKVSFDPYENRVYPMQWLVTLRPPLPGELEDHYDLVRQRQEQEAARHAAKPWWKFW